MTPFHEALHGHTIEDKIRAICLIGEMYHGTADTQASSVLSQIALNPLIERDLRWGAYVILLEVQGTLLRVQPRTPYDGFQVPDDFDMGLLRSFHRGIGDPRQSGGAEGGPV